MKPWFQALLAVLIVAFAADALAETSSGNPPAEPWAVEVAPAAAHTESRWRVGLALGYGTRTNPLIQSKDLPIVVNLDIGWFGERFFFDNGDLGLTVADNDALTLNVVGRLNSERVFFGRTDTEVVAFRLVGSEDAGAFSTGPWTTVALEEPVELTVPNRRYAVELGLEALLDGRWGMLQLTAHHDVGGAHGGYEVYVDYSHGWRAGRWYVEPSAGLGFKSAALNDYYWGVRPGEAGPAMPAYRAGRGINPHARLQLSYQMSRRWAFTAVAEYARLNGAASASPIVARRDVRGYFAGIGYRF